MALPLTDNVPRNNVYLLALFKEDLKKRLVNDALDAIRPAVELAVKDVIKELDAQISQHYDHLRQEVVVNFSVRGG